jgi:creatinine amidohydrolase
VSPADGGILDGERTSFEWRDAAPTVCVLPIGTFEQHSRHLPLACDTIEADYFGRFLARELGAALLPTLAYANSLEQTGFAGTVTLRPETLMQIVRDIADEVEGQGFATMIIVNGHGGNYALGPVVRDINRSNRALKILIDNFWEHSDPSILEMRSQGRLDMHAGEFETSLMLALRPDLVKPGAVDMAPTEPDFKQADLNTFGMGWNAPQGAHGWPSAGSREKGERIVATIKANMVPHVKQRLAWLARNKTYGGRDMRER